MTPTSRIVKFCGSTTAIGGSTIVGRGSTTMGWPAEMSLLACAPKEDLAARLETVFAGITIPEIEQNEIPAGTVRRSNVSAAATLFTAENYGDGLYCYNPKTKQ